VVEDVELVVVVVELVVLVVVLVVVVQGCVTVTVVGTVTVTVFVLRLLLGHGPSLSPRRMCALTALLATLMLTSFFEPVRWHITTFSFFGFFFAPTCGPATATDVPSPATNRATRTALSFMGRTPFMALKGGASPIRGY
jgi:hypothetical protein